MANFDYNKAKFLTIFTSQEPYVDAANNTDKKMWSYFACCCANGFVIIPSRGNQNIQSSNYIKDIAEPVKSIIKKLYEKNNRIKIWVGTPSISSMTYNSMIPYPNANNTYTRLREYVDSFSNEPYAKNIVGFYYNQEAIYTPTFHYSNVIDNNPEVTLMGQFAYYVRNTKGKDLIWIPYYGKYNPKGLPVAEVVKRNAHVADTTPIFDCVFLQSSYISNASEGNANFAAITNSMHDGYICFRDGKRGAPKKTANSSLIGAEYEWCVDPKDNRFNGGKAALHVYSKHYDAFINKKPLAFYWQNALDKQAMCQVIDAVNDRF